MPRKRWNRTRLVDLGIIVVTSLLLVALLFESGLISRFLPQQFPGQTPSLPLPAAPIVNQALHVDESPPLQDLKAVPAEPEPEEEADEPLMQSANEPDGALQTTILPAISLTTVSQFAGVGAGDYGFSPHATPPDTSGAVGATQYVQWVNTSFAVFDKRTSKLLLGPEPGNTLWSGFGGDCETHNNGDPIVQYDKAANRWVLTQFSLKDHSGVGTYLQCVAVSKTSDATGAYYRYAFEQPNFNDYPKLGIWPDGYYLSYNMFDGTTFAFLGARACAMDRSKMLKGQPAAQICFQQNQSVASLLPTDLDGSRIPPKGEPDFFLSLGTNALRLWKFHVDFQTPDKSTFTGPTNIPVAPFSLACGGTGGACVPQNGTITQLDSIGDRLMYRVAYRRFPNGQETLVVNHSVTAGQSVGIRWYEIGNPNGKLKMLQQGTFAPDSSFRWMGSMAMDKMGDIAVGYSLSSQSFFPSISVTGRTPDDPPGAMESEAMLLKGGGAQTGLHRWGDYSAMTIDPLDDCTFWFTTEYLKATGPFQNWSTMIFAFQFPGCGAANAH
jgi:hypothetical protein